MKIKIIHIGIILSGIETYLRGIIEFSNANDYEHVVITGVKNIKKPFKDSNKKEIKHFNIPLKRDLDIINDFKATIRIIQIIKNEKPNIIHAHSSKGGFIGRIVGLITQTKVLYTPHAFSYLSAEGKIAQHIYRVYEKIFRLFTDFLVACSQSEQNRAIQVIGYKKNKTRLWSNCIADLGDKFSLKTDKSALLCAVGRPSFQKNTLLMADIVFYLVKKLNINVQLKIVGVGLYSPLKEELIKKISDLDLNNFIKLIEWISREEVLSVLANSACYLSTSRYEGLSYSNIEALALGIPIVASKVDGNVETVEDGKNGFLIEGWNVADYALAIAKLLKDKDLATTMGNNSKALFEKSFKLEKQITILEKIYSDVQEL